ncbi:GAF domain-containing protein [Methanoculleus sp. Wushi-C6]|uniref:histidine kinase n=1 Tax=Methanoculleus caldifontis TaxID=2651577 RepID=A0ABU3X3M4_9EURY|nr:ATP-binding protein [Methanoculleus sp. Wushi-C6]MDV2482651.1 GAF domain-containing protein [Methanoculleus sp. Wushi-C6]
MKLKLPGTRDAFRRGCEEVSDPLRLLVVTGSPDDAGLIRQALAEARLPAEPVEYGQLAEGLDALRHQPFDLVLLDPGGLGPSAIGEVRGVAPAIPLILLVSPESLDAAVRTLRRGADDYLIRGEITPESLICSIRHALVVKRLETMLDRVEHLRREPGGSGEGRGVAIGVADITAQRRTEERVRRRNIHLHVINEVVRTATSSAGTDELLAGILEKTRALLDFDGGGAYLVGHNHSTAELVAETGLPEGFSFRRRIVGLDTPPYDAVIGRGIPCFVEDYPRACPQDAGAGIQAFASIPVVAGKRVIGAVNLVSRGAHVFSPDEREVLTSIGREVGSAVERMRLHEQANFYLDLMTHDINNANTVAIGYAMLLAEDLKGPEKELARKIGAAVWQSAEIVRNISTIRRIMEEVPAPGPVGLDPAVRCAIDLFPGADIHYTPQERWVAADDLLPAVFINLIGNAVKFGGPDVSVRIDVREEDGTVMVSVEDTGPGIPDAEKSLVFEKFRKGGRKSGKGLGLYIVRTLIERYGGKVRVEDRIPGRPECGAVFRFSLRGCPPVTGRAG